MVLFDRVVIMNIVTINLSWQFMICMINFTHEAYESENTIMSIGDTIYSLRKDSGLTQKDLAENLGVNFQTVSKWERGVSHS